MNIRCCNCGKKIVEDASIQEGFVKITCRCGTTNTIRAEKPVEISRTQSYADRLGYEKKTV